jgi:hypothetical protein
MRVSSAATWLFVLSLAATHGAATSASAGDLNPPFVGLHDVADASNMASISLPKLVETIATDNPSNIGKWTIKLYEDAGPSHMTVWLSRKSAFARAPLHASMTNSNRLGDLTEGTVQTTDHEWHEVRTTKESTFQYRMFEHGGEVFEAAVSCKTTSYHILKRHMEVLVDSAKGIGAPVPYAPPAGFKASSMGGCEVWTDVKAKADVDKILNWHADSWERMKTLLPKEFTDTKPPRVVVCKEMASFEEFMKAARVQAPPQSPPAFEDPIQRAVVVCVAATKSSAEFEKQVRRAVGVQAVRAAYGGPVPWWIEDGLSILHLFVTGKGVSADKPNPVALKDAKAAAAKRAETLKDLLDHVGPFPEPDGTECDRLVWAWHLYLRATAVDAVDKSAYEKCLSTLAQTADVRAMRAVWDGTDFASLKTAMLTWLKAR